MAIRAKPIMLPRASETGKVAHGPEVASQGMKTMPYRMTTSVTPHFESVAKRCCGARMMNSRVTGEHGRRGR